VSAIEADYENAPNPIKYILVLQDLSRVVDDYTKTVHFPSMVLTLGVYTPPDDTA